MKRDYTTYLACGIMLIGVILIAAPQIAEVLNPIAYVVPPKSISGVTPTPNTQTLENVKIQNFAFAPSPLTIPLGTTIKWTQYDKSVPHTVSAGSPTQPDPQSRFNSPTLRVDGTSTYQLDVIRNKI